VTGNAGETGADYVFLICSERCGSNLVSTMLGAHPRVKSPPPYHFARDVILNLHLRGSDAAWRLVLGQLRERVRTLGSEAQAAQLDDWLDAHPAAPACDLAQFVYDGLDAKPGTTHVFVKENNLHQGMAFVLSCFPQAKFVFQVRDPRDYLVSAEARRGFWAGNKFGSLRRALEVWRDDQLGGLQVLGLLGPQRVFFQRYEDLVSRPREVLEPLCGFLGLPFDPAMLEFHTSAGAAQRGASGDARANVAKPLMSSNFGKYRKQLSRRKIKAVETWLGDLMDRFGYERDFVPRGKVRGLHAVWPQLAEPFERQVNREREPFYQSGQKRFLRQLRGTAAPIERPYDRGGEAPRA
jgi:hypothetical protein